MSWHAPDNKRLVIIADIHGNEPTLRELLRETGAIDEAGNKDPGTWVCQLGDLLHCGHEVWEADASTLELGLATIDCILLGNHELPFATSINLGFAGMHAGVNKGLHPDTRRLLNEAIREERFHAAAEVDGWLVTHAGLSPSFIYSNAVPLELREELQAHAGSAARMADHLNERLERRLITREPDPVLEAIGGRRGGSSDFGGIFWCDWRELTSAIKRFGTPFKQIVGHSPRPDSAPIMDDTRSAWNIDLEGIDAGYCAALVKEPGEENWSCVTVRRHRRPPSSLRRSAGAPTL